MLLVPFLEKLTKVILSTVLSLQKTIHKTIKNKVVEIIVAFDF